MPGHASSGHWICRSGCLTAYCGCALVRVVRCLQCIACGTAKAVLDMVETHLPPSRGRVVLHWFTGSKAEARRAVELGCYFSVNGEMFKNDRAGAMVATLPMDRILTESDGPFTQVLGRPTRPVDVFVSSNSLRVPVGSILTWLPPRFAANLGRLLSENL